MPLPLIVANWKMNGSQELLQQYHDFFHQHLIDYQVIVCPPFPFLLQCDTALFALGAQDCAHTDNGPFTGCVSASMLKQCNAQYVILGHSERRTHFHEDGKMIQQKVQQALAADLVPIICVGESWEARQANRTESVIETQLQECLPNNPQDQARCIIAYEPLWAIGTSKIPSLEEIQSVHQVIKQQYSQCPVLYGGSVMVVNIKQILGRDCVDGVLVGGASLSLAFWESLVQP
ncbi:MAG: triose-phosphate isomerase [Alphaproteobacteria bacterium]|nr:triose-phosphate isomerase [Alphaproteobacteria bacterium]